MFTAVFTPLLVTMIVQTIISFLCGIVFETCFTISKSVIGIGSIVQSTVLLSPLGPMIVRLLVNLPMSSTKTLTVITASDLAETFVIIHVTF